MSKIKMNYCINKNLYDLKKEVKKFYEQNKVFEVNFVEEKIDYEKYLIDVINYSYLNCYELYLFYILGKTVKEISKIQNTTEKGISSRMERQRKKIKKELPEIIKYLSEKN